MKIYVSDDLEHIKNELKQRGYLIDESLNRESDAIICDLKNNDILIANKANENIKQEGVLIIDYGSKTIDDIENIINNRCYSGLF